ncbi:hypothetical protein [Chromobacterium haemolyticum]|uniref:hypothetical protein n=1 Tax=Chromobacterium haemolyticum TaxID=394935 RepID=UPI00059534F0|nr:hypothetical protein [Chromobacterium haemolyticum]
MNHAILIETDKMKGEALLQLQTEHLLIRGQLRRVKTQVLQQPRDAAMKGDQARHENPASEMANAALYPRPSAAHFQNSPKRAACADVTQLLLRQPRARLRPAATPRSTAAVSTKSYRRYSLRDLQPKPSPSG